MAKRKQGVLRRTLVGVGMCAVALPLTLADSSPANADATSTVAFYSMDEAVGSAVLVDSSVNHINGTIGTDVLAGISFNGATGHRFADVNPVLPPANIQHLDRVNHDPRLNPDDADFAVTVRYRTTKSFGNIVQKGQNTTVGGYFKFEAPTGKVTCLFKGSTGLQRSLISPTVLNDGNWHTVRCERLSTGVTMTVDGAATGTLAGPTGVIANDKVLSIGGKSTCDQIVVTCDYFVGDIDYIRFEKGSGGPANVPPTATFSSNCTGFICTFSAAASTDSDGAIQTYAWNFGDGTSQVATSDAVNTAHTYAGAGTFSVTVTVTDDRGANASFAAPVTTAPVPEVISFVGQATANANWITHAVTVPAAVQAGDGLVLFFSENTHSAITDPVGWQTLGSIDGGYATTRVWRKVAAAGDAGTVVQVGVATQSKGSLTLVAYRGTSTVDPVSAFASRTDSTSSVTRVTPFATSAIGQSWALSYWMHGDSATSTLVAPPGAAVRAMGTQTGGGRVTTLVADSSASIPLGSFGGLVATAAATGFTTTSFTIILSPAVAPPANQPPTAAFTSGCVALQCTFSGAASTDVDGTVTSYNWGFGDGTFSAGVTLTHDYAAFGTYPVTLVVTDDDAAVGSVVVNVIVAPPVIDVISFVGQSMANANSTFISTVVPAAVLPGDGLLMFISENTTATISDPTGVTGWTLLDTVNGGTTTTRVWRKVAGVGDAGAAVRVDLAAISKSNLMVVAYRGTSAIDPVASFARFGITVSAAARVTPVVTATAPSWAVSYWMHRDSTTNALVAPSGVVVRASGTQTSSGRVTALLADSGAMVATGPYGGLAATAAAASTAATTWTIILAPAP